MIAVAFWGYGLCNILVSIAALIAADFFNSVLYPVQSEQLNSLIPSGQRATLIYVNSMFFSIGMILLFPAVGVFADQWGLMVSFVGIGGVLIGFIIIWNFLVK